MIIPDVNVLVYAYHSDAVEHPVLRRWWEDALGGSRPVGMPWVVMLGFVRIMTHRRTLKIPMRTDDCLRRVREWLNQPHVQILTPGEQHAENLFRLLTQLGTAGDLTTDAHLAALAIEYQAELVSTDADFARFPGLRWFNPLKVKQR
jgi:toxin-antitoxin system PIN domain toxin